jgi:predicted RNase H-like HicB family nuclease
MTTRRFKVVLEYDSNESVWVTLVPGLNHLSAYGETREEALDRTRNAIVAYIEVAEVEQIELPSEEQQVELVEIEVDVITA